MEPVEQVFLRVRSADGFRTAEIVTTTELVRVSDMTEIVGWFTDTEENSVIRFDTLNVFFHPLPSGDYAIGIIYPEQRGFFSFLQPPGSFFVRILLVPPKTLLMKGNNPPALYEEFRRRRKIPLVSRAPKHLQPIQPTVSAPHLLASELLTSLAESPGPKAMAELMQSLFDSECTFLYSPRHSTMTILAGLFNLLPPSFRTELTFSSDLFFSVQNPFRLVGLCGSSRQVAGQAKATGIPLMTLESENRRRGSGKPTLSPWPHFVYDVLAQYRFDFLQRQWQADYQRNLDLSEENDPPMIAWEQLHVLAGSWTKEWNKTSDRTETYDGLNAFEQLLPLIDEESRKELPKPEGKRKERILPRSSTSPVDRMPHLRKEIQELDSLLTRFIFGDDTLPKEVRTVWQTIIAQTTQEEREILCEEYLALIRMILVSDPDPNRPRPAERSASLLQLMAILLEENEK